MKNGRPKKAVVLHDFVPENATRDAADNLVQASAVAKSLCRLGFDVADLAFSLDLASVSRELGILSPDLTFNIVESVNGRGSLIHLAPALLEARGMRFTGAGSAAMFATSNKIVAKSIMAASGIPTPAWISLSGFSGAHPLPGRVIVKSVWEHASIALGAGSIMEISGRAELLSELSRRARDLKMEMFAEAFVDGREFNLSVLSDKTGARVLPCAEIDFSAFSAGMPRIVDYAAKWEEGSFAYGNTPRNFSFGAEDKGLLCRLEELALRCFALFGLSGYARVDFRVDADGNPFVLEVNANPCIAPDAGFAAAADKAGMDMDALVSAIVSDARG